LGTLPIRSLHLFNRGTKPKAGLNDDDFPSEGYRNF
jgi:hypothetical protein